MSQDNEFPKCCWIEPGLAGEKLLCRDNAEWEINFGPQPCDFTQSCTRHVGDLLTDAKEHRIYPIEAEEK